MDFWRGGPPEPRPGLLDLHVDGTAYGLGILHANHVRNAGAGAAASVSHPRAHRHAVYHLVLYLEGEGEFLCGGEALPFRRGVLALVDPGVAHHFHSIGGEAFLYKEIALVLEGEAGECTLPWHDVLGRWAGAALTPRPPAIRLAPRPCARLERALDRVMAAFGERGPLVWYRAHRAVGEVLDILLDEVYAPARENRETADRPLARARQEIELRFRERLRVEELAAVACLSVSQFQRAFKNAYGLPPMRYRRELQLRLARRLLRHGELPIGRIAALCGFCDVYHFSRVFRREEGMPPGAYRSAKGE